MQHTVPLTMTRLGSAPTDSTQRWMMFVDGENFSIRGAAVCQAEGISLEQGKFYCRRS